MAQQRVSRKIGNRKNRERVSTRNDRVTPAVAHKTEKSWGVPAWVKRKHPQRPTTEPVTALIVPSAWDKRFCQPVASAKQPPRTRIVKEISKICITGTN